MTLIDLTDTTFGRLRVMRRGADASDGDVRWECVCDCGQKVLVRSNSLLRGNSKSCGCFRRERAVRQRLNRVRARRSFPGEDGAVLDPAWDE